MPTKWQALCLYAAPMIKIDILRRQHDAALTMAQQLLELVDRFDAHVGAVPILVQFNRLMAILRVHLAHEDVELYPLLVSSPDDRVARTARLFVDEMGDLAVNLECFAQHWSCSASIASRFGEFREAVHELMLALAVRIERENQYLYPLADAALADWRRDAA